MTDRKQRAIQSTVIASSTSLALLLALLTPGTQAQPTANLSQSYTDTITGLVIRYPAGWKLDTALFQGFEITDFPPNKRPPQVLVPMDHASIGISRPPEGEKTIDEWMKKERINESQGHHISGTTSATDHLGKLTITVARSQPSVIPEATFLLYFFEVEGRPIKAALAYRGRKRAAEFERIFESIIESLQPLPTR